MSLVNSKEIPLGSPMPRFKLKGTDGRFREDGELMGKKGLIVAFTCNHCPYAVAIWPRLVKLADHAGNLGVPTVGINPNASNPDYPEDSLEEMRRRIREWSIAFPYLADDTQAVAKAFDAQCTPDLYLFDAGRRLVYHGRLDDNWREPAKVAREELKEAIENLSRGRAVASQQHPSMGCSIKWR